MPDFKGSIRHVAGERGLFTTGESARRHAAHRAFIERELARAEAEGVETVVVITHHAPSPICVRPWYRDSKINSAFASNLDDVIERYQPRLWIHGHFRLECWSRRASAPLNDWIRVGMVAHHRASETVDFWANRRIVRRRAQVARGLTPKKYTILEPPTSAPSAQRPAHRPRGEGTSKPHWEYTTGERRQTAKRLRRCPGSTRA